MNGPGAAREWFRVSTRSPRSVQLPQKVWLQRSLRDQLSTGTGSVQHAHSMLVGSPLYAHSWSSVNQRNGKRDAEID